MLRRRPIKYRHTGNKRRKRWTIFDFLIISFVLFSIIYLLFSSQIKLLRYANLGKSYTLKGNYNKAKEQYNKAIMLKPDNPLIYEGLGLLFNIQDKYDAAKISYKKATTLGIKYNRKFNHNVFGEMFIKKGLYKPAAVEFERALEINPNDVNAHLGYALANHALGNINLAIAEYKRALIFKSRNKKIQSLLKRAYKDRDIGNIAYIYDRNNMPLAKYILESTNNRHIYPYGFNAAHIIGFNTTKYGSYGIEKEYMRYIPGNKIVLTIDLNFQRIAERSLGGRKGSVVILNPNTGEILAIANNPTFNCNRINTDWNKIIKNKNNPLSNRALEQLYEPGSIFKIITASAIFESKIDMNSIFPVKCDGYLTLNNLTFRDWRKHDTVESIEKAIDESCNIAFSEMGFKLGFLKIYEYANKFGFNTQIKTGLQTSMSIIPKNASNEFELANYSTGLGENFRITPIQAAMIASAIANKGTIMQPYLISEIRNIKDEIVLENSPSVFKKSITPDTANKIRDLMIAAVEKGTGTLAKVEGLTIAGKT